jgi:hypothetical protein
MQKDLCIVQSTIRQVSRRTRDVAITVSSVGSKYFGYLSTLVAQQMCHFHALTHIHMQVPSDAYLDISNEHFRALS